MKNILTVKYDGIEYRCKETRRKTYGCRNELYLETVRSKWFSKDGKELDDTRAMELYRQQQKEEENSNLIAALWGEDNE